MLQNSPLETIYYIQLPEDFKPSAKAMHIDPTIPLPVQKKDADAPGTFNMKELTEEQILSGILTVMAYDPKNTNIEYYRRFLKDARPNVKKELSEAAILKAKNEDFELAEEIFRALRGFDPEDMITVLNTALFFDQRADSYRKSGLIEDADAYDADALVYYQDALNAEPPIPDAFFNAGFFFLKKKGFQEGKRQFRDVPCSHLRQKRRRPRRQRRIQKEPRTADSGRHRKQEHGRRPLQCGIRPDFPWRRRERH